MNDPTELLPQDPLVRTPWLLFIHRLPPKPDYLRVKAQRRLRQLGAQAVKNSVYALPRTEDNLEDLEWLARDLREEGGEVMICEASFVSGDLTNSDLAARFEPPRPRKLEAFAHCIWVTREGVKVDRIATAWLIRRFVNRDASFKFVPARGYHPGPREVRFDMYEGEITHRGEQCTFEVLVDDLNLKSGALKQLAEIVHDVDCKDGKFGRAEAPGLAAMIDGLVRAHPHDDAARLEAGMPLYDTLFASLGGRLA